jgi:hypothetical protein
VGNLITDIDLIENDVLWEKKSAENAGDIKGWVAETITGKVEKYLRARAPGSPLPAYYGNAKIGFIFEGAPSRSYGTPSWTRSSASSSFTPTRSSGTSTSRAGGDRTRAKL